MQTKPLLKKCLAVGIILLFIGTVIIPSSGQITKKSSLPTSRGNWLYVGGSGPGNYTRIQDAINDSSPGYTIYVYHGTYHEALSINVMNLTLMGEGKNVTVIDANPISNGVSILQSFVIVQGFTIIAYDNFIYGNCIYIVEDLQNITIRNNNLSVTPRGVNIESNNFNIIENNVFYHNFYGILLYGGHNIIRNNVFVDDVVGLRFGGSYTEISNNTFIKCHLDGIDGGGLSVLFTHNIFIENGLGLDTSGTIEIVGNHFENNGIGLKLFNPYNSKINQNNFINNNKSAIFSQESRSHGNNWDDNYWDVSFYPFGCKFIFGSLRTRIPTILQFDPYHTSYYLIPWLNLDRKPAREPYNISGMR
jgi:parallel beta-helix repeat protein